MEALASTPSSGVSAGWPPRPRRWYLDGVGREALLDVAADAGTRVLALGQLALAIAQGLQRGGDRICGPRSSGRVASWAELTAGPAGRRSVADLACSQPAVVGVGAGEVAAEDVGPAGAAAEGLACASVVVVTGPAELPFSQADQDSCQ